MTMTNSSLASFDVQQSSAAEPSVAGSDQSGEQKMQSAIITGAETVAVQTVDCPTPDSGEVRVRLQGAGVCASDLPVWEGRPWFDYPQEAGSPGHEGWGFVDELGADVSEFQIGDRVALLSTHAYAEYDIAAPNHLVKLPEVLEDAPFPGEPLGCAVNVFRRCDIRAGQTVAIVGIGFLGSLLTALASDVGARVIAISRRPFALEMADWYGADSTLQLRETENLIERVFEMTGGDGCERVVEAVGKQDPLTLAGELTAVRGRLVVAGYHQDGLREVDMQTWNWRGLDVINAHERDPAAYRKGMQEAIELVADGRLDPSKLYTHSFALEELSRAFEMIRDRPPGFLKGLIKL